MLKYDGNLTQHELRASTWRGPSEYNSAKLTSFFTRNCPGDHLRSGTYHKPESDLQRWLHLSRQLVEWNFVKRIWRALSISRIFIAGWSRLSTNSSVHWGLTIVNGQTDGSTIGWPRVSCQCRFESPARYEDILDIHLTVQRIGVKSLTYDVRFSIDDRPVANGTMKTVCCIVQHDQPLKSIEIPDEYLSQIQEYKVE